MKAKTCIWSHTHTHTHTHIKIYINRLHREQTNTCLYHIVSICLIMKYQGIMNIERDSHVLYRLFCHHSQADETPVDSPGHSSTARFVFERMRFL